MSDIVSRQAVLKLLSTMPPEEAITKAMLIQNVKYMSAAQPEKRTEERTEKHACDCISRQAAIEALEKIDCSDGVGISSLKCDAVDDAVTAIKALPSAQMKSYRSYREGYQAGFKDAQSERKRGKWIRQDRQDNKGKPLYGWYQCSECGAFIGSNEANFCSECGADMREDDHETN